MKKIYLLATLCLFLVSCKNDDDNDENMASIVSNWKFSKAEVISGSDHTTVLYSETLAGCDANTTFEFKSDGKYAIRYFLEQNNQCQFDYEDAGLYNYDQTAQTVVTKRSNSSHTEFYKVERLNNNELVMSLYDNYDQNGDGVEDKTVYYLRK